MKINLYASCNRYALVNNIGDCVPLVKQLTPQCSLHVDQHKEIGDSRKANYQIPS